MVMFRTQCASERVEERKEGKLTPRFPMWRRKVKILHTKEGKRTGNWPSSPLAEPHITPQLGARAWLSSTLREFYRSEPRRGTNRPTKIHSFLMNCRAAVLGKQLLQTQGPRMRLATPLEPSLMPSLAAPPPPLTFRIRVIPPPIPPFTYTQVALTRTGIPTCRFCRLSSHASTHARLYARTSTYC